MTKKQDNTENIEAEKQKTLATKRSKKKKRVQRALSKMTARLKKLDRKPMIRLMVVSQK